MLVVDVSIVWLPKERKWANEPDFPLGSYEYCLVPMELFEKGNTIVYEISSIFGHGHSRDPTLFCEIVEITENEYQGEWFTILVKSIDKVPKDLSSSLKYGNSYFDYHIADSHLEIAKEHHRNPGEYSLMGRCLGNYMLVMSTRFYQIYDEEEKAQELYRNVQINQKLGNQP